MNDEHVSDCLCACVCVCVCVCVYVLMCGQFGTHPDKSFLEQKPPPRIEDRVIVEHVVEQGPCFIARGLKVPECCTASKKRGESASQVKSSELHAFKEGRRAMTTESVITM